MLKLFKKTIFIPSLAVLTLLIILAVNLQFNFNLLSKEHSAIEKEISKLIKEYEWLTLRNWILNASGGKFPLNMSNLDFASNVNIYVFFFSTYQIKNFQDTITSWATSENTNIHFLCLNESDNLEIFNFFCSIASFPMSETEKGHVAFVASKQLIIWKLDEVNQQVIEKCVKYLILSVEREEKLAN
jgi:hypothetical protein